MTEPSGYDLETLWEDGEFVLSRGVREGEPSPLLVVAPASAQPSPGSLARLEHAYALRDELDPAWAARPLRLVRRPRAADARARGPRRRAPGPAPGAALGDHVVPARCHRPGDRAGPAPRAGPHPQGRQAGPHPRRRRDRRGLADRLRHRLPPAARAPGPRAARGDRRDARLHGAGADRPHEPLGRFPERSLCAGRHLLRDADGGAALHRRRSDGVGPLPHRPAADAAGRAGERNPRAALGDRDEAAGQDRRGALPDRRGRRGRPPPLPGGMGGARPHRLRSRSARRTCRTGC